MICSESKEPQGSERSSTDVCRCGHVRTNHHWHAARGEACIGNRNLCSCRMFRSDEKPEEPKKPILRCTCGHFRIAHEGRKYRCGAGRNGTCGCQVFVCDHSACGWKPPEEEPERKKCGYGEHGFKPMQGYKDEPGKPHCITCGHYWGECNWHWVEGDPPREEPRCEGCGHTEGEGCGCPPRCTCGPDEACSECPEMPPEEPPLTPEEEEEADCPHESWEVSSQWRDRESGKWMKSRRCADCREYLDNVLDDEEHDFEGPPCSEAEGCLGKFCDQEEPCRCHPPKMLGGDPPPPQPDRRPPYAVAYSVQGHLYEVALPGDATIRAVDGALVIQHHLGPVAGIVSVLPVINEESA